MARSSHTSELGGFEGRSVDTTLGKPESFQEASSLIARSALDWNL